MSDDERPGSPRDVFAEHRRLMRRHDDAMARSFGRRPSGQEHRVWVDHEKLAATASDGADFLRELKYSGLSTLKPSDPALPRELRGLLRAGGAGWGLTLALFGIPFLTVGTAIFLFMWARAGVPPSGDALGLAFVPAFVVSLVTVVAVGDSIEARWKAWFGRPPPGSRARAVARALEDLRARPFVVRVGDVLVENLPSLSQLTAWEEELEREASDADSRADQLQDLVERIEALSRDLGERAHSDHARALRTAIAQERTLEKRARRLLGDVQTRAAKIHREIDELRARAELDALRARADDTLGRKRPNAEIAIATALDLDLGGLGADIDALRAELADERARARALTEVGAIRSG
jgi:hypothetical protein